MDAMWKTLDYVWPEKPNLKIRPGWKRCRTCAGLISSATRSDHNPEWSWYRTDKYPDFEKLASGCNFCRFLRDCLLESLTGEKYREDPPCSLPLGIRRCRLYGIFHVEPDQWGPFLRDPTGNAELHGRLELGFELKRLSSSGWRPGRTVWVKFALAGSPNRVDYVLSPRNVKWMREVLEDCDVQHDHCRRDDTAFTPTRLLDVSRCNIESDDYVRVIHFSEVRDFEISRNSGVRYAALSYRWGPVPSKARRGLYRLNDLPATINNAVDVTRALRLRYLWVDALCIDQDDDEDKYREMRQMGEIYTNAYVTIVSTDEDDRIGDQGFLYRQSCSCVIETPCEVSFGRIGRWKLEDKLTAMLAVTPQSPARINETSWSNRGWTLQEDLLSRRKLFFSSGTVYFECQQRQSLEHKRFEIPRVKAPAWFQTTGSFVGEAYNHWYEMLEKYSKRKMTHESDRLPAINGLGERVAKITRDSYVAGIFHRDAARGLLWVKPVPKRGIKDDNRFEWQQYMPPKARLWLRALGIDDDAKPSDNATQRDITNPTWSWASVPGLVKSPDERRDLKPLINIGLNASTTEVQNIRSGSATTRWILVLRGKLVLLANSFKEHHHKFYLLYLRGDTETERQGLVVHLEHNLKKPGNPERFERICYFSTQEEPPYTLWSKLLKVKGEEYSILVKTWTAPDYPGKESWQGTELKYWREYLKAKDREIVLI